MGILNRLQMFGDWLRTDPAGFAVFMLYFAACVLLTLILHEMAHGYVALRCGDDTARQLGRLSLNPLKHLDPIGTAFMFLFGFGWARPVPINPRNFKNFKRDEIFVSAAGIVTNLILFTLGTLVMIGVSELLWKPETYAVGPLTTRAGLMSLDGVNFYAVLDPRNTQLYLIEAGNGMYYASDMALYMKTPWLLHVQRFMYNFCSVNLGLAFFNVLPIPPLDGYHLFNDILLRGRLHIPQRVMQGIMVVLMVAMLTTNVVGRYLSVALGAAQGVVLRGFLSLFGLM